MDKASSMAGAPVLSLWAFQPDVTSDHHQSSVHSTLWEAKQSVLTVSGIGDDFVALVFGQAVLVDEALGERLKVRHLLWGRPTRHSGGNTQVE